jgi:acyl-CoA synthetase (AMP-forming)/AMP-acid ligase II
MFDASLAFQARFRPRDLALLTSRLQVTYGELNADVDRFSAALAIRGLGPRSGVVALQTAGPVGRYRHYVLMLALARLGVATTPGMDGGADLRLIAGQGADEAGVLRLSEDWFAATEAAAPIEVASAPRDPDRVGRVLLSSGTTRKPRRVPLTWRRIEASSRSAMVTYAGDRLGVWIIRTGIDSTLGFGLAALAWSIGATVAADFENEEIPDLLERHPAGMMSMTPIQLVDLLGVLPRGFSPKPHLRLVVAGGLLAPGLAREARLRISPDMVIDYGSTETCRITVGPATRLETTPGAVGWPVPGTVVEVVGPDGAVLADGEQGEVRVAGERNAAGYLDDPEATARTFRDGFVYPGDLGRRMADGMIVLDGRIDERINLGGVKVLPNLLETVALDYPGVRDAAAFALPGPAGIDQCWLAVVAEPGLQRDGLTAHLVKAGPRAPSLRFAWTDAIPRNAMGKIDRRALRAQAREALGLPPEA